ncbi:MAG: hypothetical protein FK733_18715 [Asgard group archaeon]|nr:hypothetical protein [Asgard group archaeon]
MKDEIIDFTINNEIIVECKKSKIDLRNYFKSFLSTSIIITMIMFAIIALVEVVRFLIDLVIFIRELINPSGVHLPYFGHYQYINFYSILPFLGLILIFIGIIGIYSKNTEETKSNWLLISRLFLISGLIYFILYIIQIVSKIYPLGFYYFDAGIFNHKNHTASSISLLIYTVGFLFLIVNLFLIRKSVVKISNDNSKLKRISNRIIITLIIVEIIHLVAIIILDLIFTETGVNFQISIYFVCSIFKLLAPLTYAIVLIFIVSKMKLIDFNKVIST